MTARQLPIATALAGDDVGIGDLWNFPSGIPHSIQALGGGCEFILVFDDGNFSEDDTFLLTDWIMHTPPDVLAKNFSVPESAFSKIPPDIEKDRYSFRALPVAMGHYVENTGSEPLRFLEMFKAPHYADLSLAQWLALIPPELVRDRLTLSKDVIASLPKNKPLVVAGRS